MTAVTRLAVFPGSFDPPTVAHVGIVDAARTHVDRVLCVLSSDPLGKSVAGRPPVADRVRTLERAGLEAAVTDARLIVDVCEAFAADAVVVGADKLAQVLDPDWYGGSVARRDEAVRRLPLVLVAGRAGSSPTLPPDLDGTVRLILLDVDPAHARISSTAARAGEPGHGLEDQA